MAASPSSNSSDADIQKFPLRDYAQDRIAAEQRARAKINSRARNTLYAVFIAALVVGTALTALYATSVAIYPSYALAGILVSTLFYAAINAITQSINLSKAQREKKELIANFGNRATAPQLGLSEAQLKQAHEFIGQKIAKKDHTAALMSVQFQALNMESSVPYADKKLARALANREMYGHLDGEIYKDNAPYFHAMLDDKAKRKTAKHAMLEVFINALQAAGESSVKLRYDYYTKAFTVLTPKKLDLGTLYTQISTHYYPEFLGKPANCDDATFLKAFLLPAIMGVQGLFDDNEYRERLSSTPQHTQQFTYANRTRIFSSPTFVELSLPMNKLEERLAHLAEDDKLQTLAKPKVMP